MTISDDKSMRIWNLEEVLAGISKPAILRMPYIDVYTAQFSPDGTRILTASHKKTDPTTGEIKYWATVWPTFDRLDSPDDPELWLATTYCPPVELRRDILGMSKEMAEEQFARCRTKVDEFHVAASPR